MFFMLATLVGAGIGASVVYFDELGIIFVIAYWLAAIAAIVAFYTLGNFTYLAIYAGLTLLYFGKGYFAATLGSSM